MLKPLLTRLFPAAARRWNADQYFRKFVMPVAADADVAFLPTRETPMVGIDLRIEHQLERLKEFEAPPYQTLMQVLRTAPEINTGFVGEKTFGSNRLHNGWYPTPDAELYACMILAYQPDQIIEVGSGFSTLIASRAVASLPNSCRIVVVDPEPRTDVRAAADQVLLQCVESGALRNTEWTPRTLLFVDSSHVLRARGDVSYLFNELIPALPHGMLVHVHDIFLPFDYPTNLDSLCYGEQYLLQALLHTSRRYRVELSTHFLSRRYAATMQRTFGEGVCASNLYYGSSFYFSIQQSEGD